LTISFQRCQRPPSGVLTEALSSLGALPLGVGANGEHLLPVADEEAFWIGLDTRGGRAARVSICVEGEDGRRVDAISGQLWEDARPGSLIVRGPRELAGVRRPDGRFDAFGRAHVGQNGAACRGFQFVSAVGASKATDRLNGIRETVFVSLVDYETFHTRTGLEPPTALDPDAGYKGWRLP
jgi:hypothetical protein